MVFPKMAYMLTVVLEYESQQPQKSPGFVGKFIHENPSSMVCLQMGWLSSSLSTAGFSRGSLKVLSFGESQPQTECPFLGCCGVASGDSK